jgi:CheY-like chemotaxis protein
MDAETLRRATEPFFTTKGAGKGTGRGLSMVHGLAAQLGGVFILSSVPGRGTRAEIWLPVAIDGIQPMAAGDDQRPPVPRTLSARILFIDDEDLVRSGTANMLSDLGHDVIEAATGHQALDLLRTGPTVDAVITDHLMPGLKGADLARKIQARRPGLPVLLISGYTSLHEAEVQGLPLLHKPFRQADLATRLAEMLSRAANVVHLDDRRVRQDQAD